MSIGTDLTTPHLSTLVGDSDPLLERLREEFGEAGRPDVPGALTSPLRRREFGCAPAPRDR